MTSANKSAQMGGPSSAGPSDERSRDQILAEREAAREAKKAAKAAKASKAGKKEDAGVAASKPKTPNAGGDAGTKQAQVPHVPPRINEAGPSDVKSRPAQTSTPAQRDQIIKPSKSDENASASLKDTRKSHLPPLLANGVDLFSNVVAVKIPREVRRLIVDASLTGLIHPAVLRLAQSIANGVIIGADSRALAVLSALREVVSDYIVPPGETLQRDLIAQLKPQTDLLQEARPLGVSVVHAIRFLNFEVSNIDLELNEDAAKRHIFSRIDHFAQDRIIDASRAIASSVAKDKLKDHDVVLTFANSSVARECLVEAKRAGKDFRVIVVDARPHGEGRRLLMTLESEGIACVYGLVSSLTVLAKQASLVLLGTASVLGNGALYARNGTAACAMTAHALGVPVIACCETYKFSEQIRLDALSLNEAGSPDALPRAPTLAEGQIAASDGTKANEQKAKTLPGALHLVYDVTPPQFITAIACEVGFSAPERVGMILREYKSMLYVQ